MAQDTFQTIRGRVVDEARRPMAGATVSVIKGEDSLKHTLTDEKGKFTVKDVSFGSAFVLVRFQGYQVWIHEVRVGGGKEVVLDVLMEPAVATLREIEIRTSTNLMPSTPSTYELPIDLTQRAAANFFDPARLATSLPGVIAANDQNNDLIIRGNSPNGLLWRLEGVDIVNPNHLSNAGTFSDRPAQNGGGVNILSAQLLDRSQLHMGALSPEFGNAQAGVMDLKLRPGNNQNNEFILQGSLLGFDAAAEGPLGNGGSFIANARYATVGLLTGPIGLDFGGESINFSDFSFHLDHPIKNSGKLSIFGFTGTSSNVFEGGRDSTQWENDKDSRDINFRSKTRGIGTSIMLPVGRKSYLSLTSAMSGFNNFRLGSLVSGGIESSFEHNKNLWSSRIEYTNPVNKTLKMTTGLMVNRQEDHLIANDNSGRYSQPEILDDTLSGWLIQPYVNARWTISEKLSFSGGLRAIHFTYNKSGAVEPRAALYWDYASGSSLSLSYALQSTLQTPGTYLTILPGIEANQNLGLNQSHNYVLSHTWKKGLSWQVRSELFFQDHFNVAIGTDPERSFSTLNLMDEFVEEALVMDGSGRNYGFDLWITRRFPGGSYIMGGGSVYKSEFADISGRNLPTRFNGGHTLSMTAGHEFRARGKNNSWTVDARWLHLGGLRYNPIDAMASADRGYTVEDLAAPFSRSNHPYYRLDLRLSLRKDKARYTRILALDIQNVLNRENDGFRYFDQRMGALNHARQLGIIPVLVYRVEF